MLVLFDIRCRFLVGSILFLRLLVDATTSVSGLNSSAYIDNSFGDLSLSDTRRNASSADYIISVKPTYNATNLPSSFVLSTSFSSHWISVHVLSHSRSAGSNVSHVPETITKTLIIRNTETAFANRTATVVDSQKNSTSRMAILHSNEIVTSLISSTVNASLYSQVKTSQIAASELVSSQAKNSTTRLANLHSSEIVTSPILSTVNGNYSWVKTSQIAAPKLVSSEPKSKSYEHLIKTLSNSTQVDSLLNSTTSIPANSSFNISRTLSEAVVRTTKTFVSPSLSRASVLYSEENKTSIYNTTVLSDRQSKIEWTKTMTTAANFTAYEDSMYFDNSNSTVVQTHIASSSYHSTFAPLNGLWSSTNVVNKSGKHPDRSSAFTVERTTGLGSIIVITASSFLELNNTPRVSPNMSRTLNVEATTGSATLSTTLITASLHAEPNSYNGTSRNQSTILIAGNKTLTTSEMTLSSTTKLNSSSTEHYSNNTAYNTSYTISVQSTTLLNTNESQTKEDVFSASRSVASHDASEWIISSTKQQLSKTPLPSSRNDIFNTSEVATSTATSSRHSKIDMDINETDTEYSTTPLPTPSSFTEQIIKNTTILSFSGGDHEATSMITRSRQIRPENTSSVNFEEQETAPVSSSLQFTSSISRLQNSSLSIKPLSSLVSDKETPTMNSPELSTQASAHNISSSMSVSYPATSVNQTAISPRGFSTKNLYNTSKHSAVSSQVLSADTRFSQATVNSSSPFGSKSSFSIDFQVNSSNFDAPFQISSNVKVTIKSTAQVSQPGSTNQPSSDLFDRSSPDVTDRLSRAIQTSGDLPFRESAAKINSVSVVPIFTPCYISYVVTMSRREMQLLPTLTPENRMNTSSTLQRPSHSHSSNRLLTSTQFRPTPSTVFATKYSSTEMVSNIPTQSLSRLPDRIESSVQSRQDATMTYSSIGSKTISKSFSVQLDNSDISTPSVAVSSIGSHELIVSGNTTAETQNYTFLVNHSGSISPIVSTPSQNSSLLSKSVNTFTMHKKSSSMDTYINSSVSKATTLNSTISAPPSFSRTTSGNHISQTPVLSSSVATTGELVYTSITKNGSNMPSSGQPVLSSSVTTTEELVYASTSKNGSSHTQTLRQPVLSSSVATAGELVYASASKNGPSHTRTLGQPVLSSSVAPAGELIYASTSKNGSSHSRTSRQPVLSSSVAPAGELVYASTSKNGPSHTRMLRQPVLSSSVAPAGELVYASTSKNGSSHSRTVGQPVLSSTVATAGEMVYASAGKNGSSHTRTLGQPVLSSSLPTNGELVYTSINNRSSLRQPVLSTSVSTIHRELVYASANKNGSRTTILVQSVEIGRHSASTENTSSIFSGSLSNEMSKGATKTNRVFTTNIALNTTLSSPMLFGTILSTTSASQFGSHSVDDHSELSFTSLPETFSLGNYSGNIKTSRNIQATTSSNYMFTSTIRNTTAYFEANNTSVPRLSPRLSLNLTNVRTFETTKSTVAYVTSLGTNATNTQSVKSESQNVLQPTPLLSRTPTLNNLISVPSSSIPVMTSFNESLSNQRTSTKSTLAVVTDFHNSTLVLLSSFAKSDKPSSSASPLVSHKSTLSNRTTQNVSSYLPDNKTIVLTTSSMPVVLHTPSAGVNGGKENASLTESINIQEKDIPSTSIENIRGTSIKPTVVLATMSYFNSKWSKSVPSSNSTRDKTVSSSVSFRATQSLLSSTEIATNPLRRKRRDVRNFTVGIETTSSTHDSSKIEIGNSTIVPTVNISKIPASTSPLKTPENVGPSSSKRFLSLVTENVSRTVQTLLVPTASITNATNVTLNPSLVQTLILEKPSTTTSWNRSVSHHPSSISGLTASIRMDYSVLQLTTSTYVVSSKHTNSVISIIRNASFVESSSTISAGNVSSTTNSVNGRIRTLSTARYLTSSQVISTKPGNSIITGVISMDMDSLSSNRSSSRSKSENLITSSFSQIQHITMTSTYPSSTYHSIVLLPSTTEQTKNKSVVNGKAINNSIVSATLTFGLSSNSSTITMISASSPNLTLSVSEQRSKIAINASKSSLNTNLNTSLKNDLSNTPTIKDSLYKSSMNPISNPILSTSQQRYESNVHTSESSLYPNITESYALMSTSKTILTQILRTKSSLFSPGYTRVVGNRSTINNTVPAVTNATVLSPVLKSTNNSADGIPVVPTSIIDKTSPATTSDYLRDSHSSTRLRSILETTVGGQSSVQTFASTKKLSLNQTANISTAFTSSPRGMPYFTASLKNSLLSVITISSPATSFIDDSLNQSADIAKMSMVNSATSKVDSTRLEQFSRNATSFIAPVSVSSYLHNATSLMDGNISFPTSSIMTSYLAMTPSPSPSFTVMRSKGITATPVLPDESYSLSEAVLERSSSLKMADTVSKLDQTTDVENHFTVNSSSLSSLDSNFNTSRILETESRSKTFISSRKESNGYFTYFVIPTSSLGLCFVSYSTILLNGTVQSSVTLNGSRVSATTVSRTRLSVSSPGFVNSTGVLASASLFGINASSKQLLHSSLNRTLVVIKASQDSSLVVNESSTSITSQSDERSSGITFSTYPLKLSVYSMNSSNHGHTLSTNLGNRTSVGYIMSSPSILSHTVFPVLPSPTLSKLIATYIGSSSLHSESSSTPLDNPKTSTVIQILPTVSSIVESSSIVTTHAPTPVDENAILLIVLRIPENVSVNTDMFKTNMEEKLNIVYQKGLLIERRRRKRSVVPHSSAKIQNVQRKGEEVDVKFIIIAGNTTVSAQDAANTMNSLAVGKLNEVIGYEVLSRPAQVPKEISPVEREVSPLAMLVKTKSQSNLSNAAAKKNFETELASFYNSSATLQVGQTVKAIVTKLFFEKIGRTYIEFIITVDSVTVDRSQARVKLDDVNGLSKALNQEVLAAPYIPGILKPTAMHDIIQNMQFDNVRHLNDTIKKEIANKLTQVYVEAVLKTSQKRRKRALGSIDTVITNTEWTTNHGYSADVTYYITDAGSILNATYACSVLKRLTLTEMSSITAPYVVNTTPRPLTATTSKNTEDDDYPSWFIPVVIAGSIGFLLLVLIIILYCRWKKGAPAKKVEPKAGSPVEEQVQKPRMTHAAEPEPRPALRRTPPTPTAVTVEENGHSELRPRPAPRKLPVREGSMRRKVLSRESISTRTNPAYTEEESGEESVTEVSVPRSRRGETNVVVGRRTQSETPRRTVSRQEILQSDEEDESDESEGESVANTDQHSAATLPTIAVMSDPRSPEIQPPVRFRPTVHPEPSLPPLDLKHTSLIGRVVEEEGSVQKEIKTKADIERWRNKQRQRDKRMGESLSRSGNKRPSFTEKKAWGRAQQEIGAVLDPEAMQPIVRKPRRKLRRKYKVRAETSEDEGNVELRGFKKLTSPREEKVSKEEQESDSDISMGEARRRMIALIDDAFTSIKSASKKHPESVDQVDAGETPQGYPPSKHPPPLYPRPATLTPALPEPPPSHGRASVPSARHRRRFMNSQNSLPYPSQYYPGMSGSFSPRYPPPPPPPVVTRNPLVVWDPADKQRIMNQSAYRPYGGHPYSYTDPSGKLHFTPVQQTPDGMGGLVWSPYTTEYAMEDFYRNVEMPGTLDTKNSSFLSKMQETPLGTMSDSTAAPRDAVIDMPGEAGTRTGESAEPLVRAIKDELFRLASGRTPVKHL